MPEPVLQQASLDEDNTPAEEQAAADASVEQEIKPHTSSKPRSGKDKAIKQQDKPDTVEEPAQTEPVGEPPAPKLPAVHLGERQPVMATRITRMVLHGFKSFADRTELLFSPDYNVILGPNGSGKSNVFDAVCFVLGKSSAKSMRAEKSANLIYNGGRARQPHKQAEVSIFFDNEKKAFPIQGDEIKITRLVRQDGQSKYKINDQTRSRQEVLDLMSRANIDPDGF
ncbi:hypothetical protein COV94_02925, partial [Candidatus Woesearchaeota archaeon CG11_big_fil_rev_8_21_14_0_20_57_5]